MLSGGGLIAAQAPLLLASDRTEVYKSAKEKFTFDLGIASYTFREFSLEDTIRYTNRLGISKLALKSMHLPLESTKEEIRKAKESINLAGIDFYGAGVIYMNNKEEVDRAFSYAEVAELKTIIGVPAPELLEYCSKKVESYDIKLAIHNHGPGDKLYPGPGEVYEKIRELHPKMGLCVDIGHTQRIGLDPAKETAKYIDRVHDIHIKDVNRSDESGATIEIGRGLIDIPAFLKLLVKKEYRGVVSFEFEKDGKDPIPGLSESVGYVRGVLRTLEK